MALRLERSWAALNPDMSNVFNFELDTQVRQLLVIPGGRMIVLMHPDSLTCWSVGDTARNVKCVGTWMAPCSGCHAIMDTSSLWNTLIAVGPAER